MNLTPEEGPCLALRPDIGHSIRHHSLKDDLLCHFLLSSLWRKPRTTTGIFYSHVLCTHRRCLFPGDNILSVLKYLVTSERLADWSEYRHGNMVFFDLLGVIVVAYPARVGTILNYIVAAATFLYLAKKASLPGNGGRKKQMTRVCECVFSVVVMGLSPCSFLFFFFLL